MKVHNPLHKRYIYFFFRSNLLDATLIHPESYELAEWLLTSQGFSTKDIGTQNLRNHFLNQIDIKAVKKAMVDENIYSESKSQEKTHFLLFLFLYFSSNIPYCIFLGLFQSTMTLTKEKTIWIKLLKLYKWNFLLILEIVILNERYVE